MEVITFTNDFNNNFGGEAAESSSSSSGLLEPSDELSIELLSKLFTEHLKKAKKEHLECGEVLLPTDLTKNLARDVHHLAEAEPYGLRGCTIYINFEGVEQKRSLSVINCDPTTPTTFQLCLTLKQASNGWNNFLPQFIKKMTRGGTVMISSDYELRKKKLYRSYDD